MLCDVKRGESPPDTGEAANPEAGILSEFRSSSRGPPPSRWGTDGAGQDTLQGASVAPVGGCQGLCICVCTWCEQAWRLARPPRPVGFPASRF